MTPADGGAAGVRKVTARKHGKHGTRYAAKDCTVIFWPCGSGYASILLRPGCRAIRSMHATRADAAYLAGEWVYPVQDGRYILDNDDIARRAVAA